MTSTTIYTSIPPTYLYIKQHSITRLKYFGKTTRNPYKYSGSGKYWLSHIKKHGKEHIVTLWVSGPYHDKSIVDYALRFSEENNIVESSDWANLKPENGLDGGTSEQATINNNKLVLDNRHPWQKRKGASVGAINNKEKVENGTHQFLMRDDGTSISSDAHKNRSIEEKGIIRKKTEATFLEKYNAKSPLQNKDIAAREGLKKHNKSLQRFNVETDEELYNMILNIAKEYNLYNKNNEPNITKISNDHFSYYGKGSYQFLWKCYNLLKPPL
jgi:hypothetical protein